jgi:hypothetical protein
MIAINGIIGSDSCRSVELVQINSGAGLDELSILPGTVREDDKVSSADCCVHQVAVSHEFARN